MSDEGVGPVSEGSDYFMTPMGDSRPSVFWPPAEDEEVGEEGERVSGGGSLSMGFRGSKPPPRLREGEEEETPPEEIKPGSKGKLFEPT